MGLLDFFRTRRQRKAKRRHEREKELRGSQRRAPERELDRQAAGALWGRDTPRE